MPNIVEYTSKSEITPSDKGINAAQDAGRLYGRVGDQIGRDINRGVQKVADAVERHMAIMEASELYKTGTELKQNLQTRYEKESALPENRNDPHFGERFMAEVGPLLDEWGKGVSTDHGKQLAITLGAGIRNEIFNHVAAGQSEMDAAHVQDNLTQTVNSLGSGLITDPSAINLSRTIGTAKDAIQGMTMAIPDVRMREQVASELTARYLPQLVIARYRGVAESIKNQIAENGGETSPARQQLDKDVAAQLGFQYISPENQEKITELGAEAVHAGQELYRSKQATIKSQTVEAGKTAFAQIHNIVTELALEGKPPTPDVVNAIHNFSQMYGASNPGEAASLDDYLLRTRGMAQKNAVQPYNQQVRDKIQAGMALPKGDPRRPTEHSLLQAYSHGQITAEDLSMYTNMLDKVDRPEKDPAFGPAHAQFVRWQNQMLQLIGGNNMPGTAAARAQFLHDSMVNFMAWGRKDGDWDKTLSRVTDPHNPSSFGGHMIKMYQRAALKPNAADFLSQNWPRWNPDGTITWPSGNPPTAQPRKAGSSETVKVPPAPAHPAADLEKADEILWGKH